MEGLSEYGLWGLGIAAFLAATILPLSSELVLSALLLSGESSFAVLAVATLGNVLGSLLNYLLGRWGADSILHRWLKLSTTQIDRAKTQFNRYGLWSLLFAWLPIIGDPLTFIAGIMKVKLWLFLLLVTLGKFGRYWVLSQLVLANQ